MAHKTPYEQIAESTMADADHICQSVSGPAFHAFLAGVWYGRAAERAAFPGENLEAAQRAVINARQHMVKALAGADPLERAR